MKRILLLRGGALGDFLVTLPLLRALRSSWPQVRIEVVGNARAAELAVLSGIIDAAHSQAEGRWARLYSREPLPGELRAWLEAFDIIVSFWPDPGRDLAHHLPVKPSQQFVQRDATVTTAPAAAHFLGVLPALGFESCGPLSTLLVMPPEVQQKAESRLQTNPGHRCLIGVHPGSGSARKNWPVDRWCGLIRQLDPCPVLVVLGEAENTLAPAFRSLASARIQIAEQWPLPVLAAALARCAGFLGHDTGVSHLAAAMGARCVLLFGPTDPAIWAPPSEQARVLRRSEALEDIAVTDVLAALRGE